MTTVEVKVWGFFVGFFSILLSSKESQCFKDKCISPFTSGAKKVNVTSELMLCLSNGHAVFSK